MGEQVSMGLMCSMHGPSLYHRSAPPHSATAPQAGALVHIYTDGTVLLTHGGVEMGQGLHTKMAQICAHTLGLPLSSVYIAETATDKVPNASATAASASSDIYGGAGEAKTLPWQPSCGGISEQGLPKCPLPRRACLPSLHLMLLASGQRQATGMSRPYCPLWHESSSAVAVRLQ